MTGWRTLSLLGAVFLVGFTVQRCRSPFVRIAADRELAQMVAAQSGLSVAEVMALRELCGVDLTVDALNARAERLVAERQRLGAGDLAVLVVTGHVALAESLLAESDGDADLATKRLRPLPEAIGPVRFRAMTQRFRQGLR